MAAANSIEMTREGITVVYIVPPGANSLTYVELATQRLDALVALKRSTAATARPTIFSSVQAHVKSKKHSSKSKSKSKRPVPRIIASATSTYNTFNSDTDSNEDDSDEDEGEDIEETDNETESEDSPTAADIAFTQPHPDDITANKLRKLVDESTFPHPDDITDEDESSAASSTSEEEEEDDDETSSEEEEAYVPPKRTQSSRSAKERASKNISIGAKLLTVKVKDKKAKHGPKAVKYPSQVVPSVPKKRVEPVVVDLLKDEQEDATSEEEEEE